MKDFMSWFLLIKLLLKAQEQVKPLPSGKLVILIGELTSMATVQH